MKLRKRCLLSAAVFGAATFVLPAVASSVTTPVEAVNEGGIYGETHRWSPSQETVMAGDAITFRNSTEVPHGVEWRSAVKPVCEEGPGKVPVGSTPAASGTKWSGACTFAQAGTYTFYCTVHGAAMSGTITVTNGAPTVTTEAATSVTEHEATLKGTVNPNGMSTEYFFEWGTTASYGKKTSMKSAGAGTTGVAVSAMPEEVLTPGTTYHFRLVAKNEKGITEGADETFTTASPPPPPGPPTATTGEATAVSETEAMLKGMVNPNGKATEYAFDYGTSTAYGQHSTELVLGATDHTSHPVSVPLTGLTPGTTYHFKLVAKNEQGPAEGADGEFKTSSTVTTTTTPLTTPPPATTPVVTPPPPKTEEVLAPVVAGSLRLAAPRHGSVVRGSLDVSQSGAGGRLEVDLLAKGASLARRVHSKSVTVGRLVRKSVSAGKLPFSVALNARAKSALRRHHRLALTVKITLMPPIGKAVTITRSVVLRA